MGDIASGVARRMKTMRVCMCSDVQQAVEEEVDVSNHLVVHLVLAIQLLTGRFL